MQLKIHESIDDIPTGLWNALVPNNDPFLGHEFLAALEHNGCVGEHYGWRPRHLSVWKGGCLVGAMPLYAKTNSYGEFVFDSAWAEAYRQQGMDYYPKLVSCIPYTPASGERLLVAKAVERGQVVDTLISGALELARLLEASSVHWLFPAAESNGELQAHAMIERTGCQFHWQNRGYGSFEEFLSALTSKRRKNIRRERRLVGEAGIRLQRLHGPEVTADQWRLFARFYAKTFEERCSLPTLNEGFFVEVGQRLGRRVILVLAHEGERCVAGALLFRSRDTLYGRHWGCLRDYDSLHFEACYYQGIEYCIEQGLRRFEPGAQGEHKIWRGFLPVITRSQHWIAHRGFRQAIDEFLSRERRAVTDYALALSDSSPFRERA